jgi:DNA-directed RNA polymerase sigma subunit (sigma70/sigma32)
MIVFAKKIFSDRSNVLSKREKIIVADNLFLGKTLEEIAEPLSLSTERVRQIRNCGLSKLRCLLS